jgi:hypothetical protein
MSGGVLVGTALVPLIGMTALIVMLWRTWRAWPASAEGAAPGVADRDDDRFW